VNTKCYPGNLKGRDHLGDIRIDGKIILKWNVRCGVESSCSGKVIAAGCCVYDNEHSGSINDEFLH
jgi:hypothetical protein